MCLGDIQQGADERGGYDDSCWPWQRLILLPIIWWFWSKIWLPHTRADSRKSTRWEIEQLSLYLNVYTCESQAKGKVRKGVGGCQRRRESFIIIANIITTTPWELLSFPLISTIFHCVYVTPSVGGEFDWLWLAFIFLPPPPPPRTSCQHAATHPQSKCGSFDFPMFHVKVDVGIHTKLKVDIFLLYRSSSSSELSCVDCWPKLLLMLFRACWRFD